MTGRPWRSRWNFFGRPPFEPTVISCFSICMNQSYRLQAPPQQKRPIRRTPGNTFQQKQGFRLYYQHFSHYHLVIVGRNRLKEDEEGYLLALRKKFSLPISYRVVSI